MKAVKQISQTKSILLFRRQIGSRNQSLWTQDNVVKSPYKDIEIPNTTVTEQIWKNLVKWEDKTAVVCGVTNQSYTYIQLYKYSKNLAANLRAKLRIRNNDVVCIMMPNCPDYAVAVTGILEAGGQVTTVNPVYTAHEINRQISLSDPKAVIGTPQTIPVIKEALKLAYKNIPIISCNTNKESNPENTINFEELARDDVDHSTLKEVNTKVEDVALLPYSSGTTGLPKGVELTCGNIVANINQIDVEGVRHYYETTRDSQDSVLGVLPFFHVFGLTVIMLHKLSVGLKIVTLPKFHPDTFLNVMKEHKMNLVPTVPPLILFMGSSDNVTKEHLAHVKMITCGAAPLPLPDVEKVLEKCNAQTNLIQIYGLTETSPAVTSLEIGSKDYRAAGYAVPNTEQKIVDENMQALGPNKVGELFIKGPQVMKGYRNNPEATKASITADGWFKTGDLGSIDEKGVLTIADRLKELIKVKGFQVPPAELENVLKEHPGVQDAAVIGIPDQKQGETPKAFVVVKEGHKVEENEIKKFVEERVAAYKKVKEVTILDEIPKNPAGKILRRVLRERFC